MNVIDEYTSQEQDLRTMDPYEVIKAAAEGMGIVLKNPNPNCKHCHGRGWIGRHSEHSTKGSPGEPIPCKCIFEEEKLSTQEIGDVPYKPRNRAERRRMK